MAQMSWSNPEWDYQVVYTMNTLHNVKCYTNTSHRPVLEVQRQGSISLLSNGLRDRTAAYLDA
jgi:hypothetical protein